MPKAKIARPAADVKRPSAASQKNTRDGYSRRPDVLRRMPLSCNVVFDVLRTYAKGKATELSIRELAEMCRLSYSQTHRALRRLMGANLIRWQNQGPGRGRRSLFEVRWTLSAFPQENDPPHARESLTPQRFNTSFCEQKTARPSSQTNTPQLNQSWRPSERAIRWALARARDRLWGLPRPRRERAVEALARAFRQAARQPGPWDRDRWRRFVFNTIAKFEAGPAGFTESRRRPYSWAALCAKDALGELANREAASRAAEELLDQIRRDREAARAAWAGLTAASSSAGRGACPAGPLVQPRSLPGERGRSGVHRAPGCSQGAIPPAGPTGPPSRARLPTPARYLQP